MRKSTLAATALALARSIDDEHSSTARSNCANSLLAVWDRLLELQPPDEGADDLDDLAARRATRRDRIAAAANLQHPAKG